MWVVQSNLINANQLAQFAQALRDEQIPFQDVGIIPFSDDFITPIELSDLNVIPYGSTSLMKNAIRRGWRGVFFDRNTFTVPAWIANRDDMLNQKPDIMTVETAMEDFKGVHPDSLWFIRPIEDLKTFNGTVTTAGEIKHWFSSVESGNFSFSKETLVAVSHPQEILAEWRYFIVGGKVISGSMYRMRGLKLVKREEDKDVLVEAQVMADKWLPHETCVMDLALTNDGVKVIEFNCLNASGFYYHDLRNIVRSVTDYFSLNKAL